jgi:hypothetical protein
MRFIEISRKLMIFYELNEIQECNLINKVGKVINKSEQEISLRVI